jgi:pyruvate formate lyase activating enzyme
MTLAEVANVATLKETLERLTAEGEILVREDGKIRCLACGHRCRIPEGHAGICKVRYVKDDKLLVPSGYVGAIHCDPVEKKPFFHALPGSQALTFGMLGCDLHCAYCQNWLTSQALRDPEALAPPIVLGASQIVELAQERGARLVVSSYNEPLITSEWAVEVFREARAAGLTTAFVSNGNGTREVLTYLRPWVDLYKVDLKSFRDKSYRALGGLLENVQRTIQMLVEMKFWVEIVTLVIPGFNDTDEELSEMARFLASVSRDLPWHVTGFHQDYKMTDPDDTPVKTLLRAAAIGREAGLRFVYAGNRPGKVGNLENTYCPDCGTLLVERFGFRVLQNQIRDGGCPSCRTRIPGLWS